MKTFCRTIAAALALALAAPALAVLPGTSSRVDLVADGVGKSFAFTFKTYAVADVEVYLSGVKQGSGFTVALAANQDASPGGTVTFTNAPAAQAAVRIQRTVPLTQALTLTPGSAFPAKSVEKTLDRLAMGQQQLARDSASQAAVDAATALASSTASTHAADKAAQTVKDAAQDGAHLAEVAARGVEDAAIRAQVASAALGGGVSIADTSTVQAVGGTAAPTLRDWMSFRLNARSYGAKGDFDPGSGAGTDDTVALQSALDDCYAKKCGAVFVPRGVYKVTGTLTMREGVGIIGDGIDRGWNSTRGTVFAHRPTNPSTDFLVIEHSVPGSYAQSLLRDFRVWGDGVKSRDGIYHKGGALRASNVDVLVFAGKALRLRYQINSVIESSYFGAADYGVYFDPAPGDTATLSTSVSFRSCYFGSSNRIGAYVTNAIAVEFTGWTVFESPDEHGLVVDGGNGSHAEVALINPYFENIARSAIRVGETGLVRRFVLLGGMFETGPLNDNAFDYFYFDRVLQAQIEPTVVAPANRVSVIRTTANTGTVLWNGTAGSNQTWDATAGTRADATGYTKGNIINVTCDDSIVRRFMVVSSGTCTSAVAQPAGYAHAAVGIVDGTCTLSSYGDGQEYGAAVFYDPRKVVSYAAASAPTPIRAGFLQLAGPAAADKIRRISYVSGAPAAGHPAGNTPSDGDLAWNIETGDGTADAFRYVKGKWEPLTLPISRTAAPVANTWRTGQFILNAAPGSTPGSIIGWYCTAGGAPGTWVAIRAPAQATAQSDSAAADVATLKTDFNALLAKLRTAGLMAP